MSSNLSDFVPPESNNRLAVWENIGLESAQQLLTPPQLVPAPDSLDVRIPIRRLDDIVKARRSGRLIAMQIGCSGSRVALVLTAISELARNIISYADQGDIILSRITRGEKQAVVVTAKDRGPGIDDVSAVANRSTAASGSGELGLSGLKQCMDRFSIESQPGVGTQVTCEVRSK